MPVWGLVLDALRMLILIDFMNIFFKKRFLFFLIFVFALTPLKLWAITKPNDPLFFKQWYLDKIHATEAWDSIHDAEEIVVAVIDTGVQINHPDLKDNIWLNKKEIPNNGIDDDKNGFIDDLNGWDFVNNVADPSPKFKDDFTLNGILHGTVVAGVIGAVGNNKTGVSGVAWRLKIMPLKVLDDKGEGSTADVVRAIDYAIKNGADIINLSFVGFKDDPSLKSAIERAYYAGVIVVAAAGNDNEEGEAYFLDKIPMYPVCYDGDNGENMVIGVVATDAMDQKAKFSAYGSRCIDISAPGVSIFNTAVYNRNKKFFDEYFDKYYDGYWSGTSMATPIVSGAIALIEAQNKALNRQEVVNVLLDSADNINKLNLKYLNKMGRGRLNVYKAVNLARSVLFANKKNIIVAPSTNGLSNVELKSYKGNTLSSFPVFASNFKKGVNISAGDLNGDGNSEIVVGAGYGGGPQVRIFDSHGKLLGQFFAYNKNFRGGVHIASGDLNGDGKDEIITGAGFTGGPQVRIFDSHGKLLGQFFAYNKNFRGGVRVAIANMGSGAKGSMGKIITAPGKGGGSHIKIFNKHADLIGQFFAYDKKFKGGTSLFCADMDKDGIDEIITGAGPGGAPHVRVFRNNGTLYSSFYAYDADFSGGVNVAVINVSR